MSCTVNQQLDLIPRARRPRVVDLEVGPPLGVVGASEMRGCRDEDRPGRGLDRRRVDRVAGLVVDDLDFRVILEEAGVHDVLCKSLGSANHINVASPVSSFRT